MYVHFFKVISVIGSELFLLEELRRTTKRTHGNIFFILGLFDFHWIVLKIFSFIYIFFLFTRRTHCSFNTCKINKIINEN